MGSANSSTVSGPVNSPVKQFKSVDKWKLYFNELKDSSKLMVIDFSASWCPPSKFMEPVMDAMATKFADVDFIKIDVDELPDVSKEWKVNAMPTFVLVKKGKEVGRVIGARKNELENMILKHREPPKFAL